MNSRCRHDDEHPVVAWIGVAAVLAAIVLITWARLEVHGTGDIEAVLEERPLPNHRSRAEREVDDAVAASRFATGFTP